MGNNTIKKPNFLIVGAARSGTTTFAKCLSLHPDVYLYLSSGEPKFFSREQEYAKGIEYYLNSYFKDVEKYKAVGEKSTEYMENLSVAERVYRFNPQMQLICILRDPVERTISNYWWSVYNGVENRQINEAISIELKNYLNNSVKVTRLFSSRPTAYIDRSIYYDNLLPFYNLFPKENISCILFEEFIKDKKKIINNTLSFLNVSLVDLTLDSVEKERCIEREHSLDIYLLKELYDFFAEKNKKLSELIEKDISFYLNAEK